MPVGTSSGPAGGSGGFGPPGMVADVPAIVAAGTGVAMASQPMRDYYAPAVAAGAIAGREAEPPGEGRVLSGYYYHPVDSIFEQLARSVVTVASAEPPRPDAGPATAWPPGPVIPLAIHQFDPPCRAALAMAEPPAPDPGSATISGWSWSGAWVESIICGWHVYGSQDLDGPIDYAGPLAVLPMTPTSWTSTCTLQAGGTTMFGVRAFNGGGGEEQNLDCAVAIALDACGNDITNRPGPPYGVTATPTAGAGIRVEWWYPRTDGPAAPAGFNVYCTAGASVNYATVAATVLYSSGYQEGFVANLTGLTSGTSYSIGVRAYNACGPEQNTAAVAATADGTGPAAVDSLAATAVV